MSPRTRVIPLVAVLFLLTACGAPPQRAPVATKPSARPFVPPSGAAVPPLPDIVLGPLGAVPTTTGPLAPTLVPTYPAYPTTQAYPTPTRTTAPAPTTAPTAPLTVSPTPTPSHAPKCSGEPTARQILSLIEDDPGVPDARLAVAGGPFCAAGWSFTTVKLAGEKADEAEVLMVVATGKGSTLAKVAVGTDVCNNRVQSKAPPGIRVLACGL